MLGTFYLDGKNYPSYDIFCVISSVVVAYGKGSETRERPWGRIESKSSVRKILRQTEGDVN